MYLMKSWLKSSHPKEENRFLGAGSVCMHAQLCPTLLRTPCIVAHKAPLSRFPKQEYWGVLPFPSPGNRPNSGIEAMSPTPQAGSLPYEPAGCRKHRGSKTR